ncbi:hypothetical protein CI109_106831 [Kwoniella shandongensis]|uniref:Uncharacterized protein n=1 Tax=Kwoniella shandongensis TaxID=1734106 RepID=A0A5M6C6S7_9TREE|nr:uncharacterized protein CI109_000913 [Kwoniella shandongensis]KAA5530733.1 hypothetical protein CI109_000913 [Kwoniella shandongensis]
MSPPRRHRRHLQQQPSLQSIRSHAQSQTQTQTQTYHSGLPQTRSMARLAASTQDENTKFSSTKKSLLTKSLRSRGPLKEMMNVLEEKKGLNANGKRKGVYDDGDDMEGKGKMMKMDGNGKARGAGGLGVKIGSNQQIITPTSSLESLRPQTQKSTPSSTPSLHIHKPTTTIPPTPAREILRHGILKGETSPTDSPPSALVARPPTPPRPRERSGAAADASTLTATTTPKRSRSPMEDGMDVNDDVQLSKMPASLRKTPNKVGTLPTSLVSPNRPTTTPSLLITPARPFSQSQDKSSARDDNKSSSTLAAPTTIPHIAPSPRRVFAGLSRLAGSTATTTPKAAPPVTMSSTPSVRVTAPSPIGSRVAAASKAARENQSTLLSFMQRSATPKKEVNVGTDVHSSATISPKVSDMPEVSATTSTAQLGANKDEAKSDIVMELPSTVNLELLRTNVAPTSGSPQHAEEEAITAAVPVLRKSSSSMSLANMGPPSRIPRSTRTATGPTAPTVATASAKKPSTGLGSLPERRPSTRPSMVSSSSSVTATPSTSSMSPVKRKPSYPSSLGSGPLARPTQRMVSNPVLPPRALSNPTSAVEAESDVLSTIQPRSVSAPVPRPRLSMSTSRREGLSTDTSKSLAGLSEALNKLKAKKLESASSSSSVSEPMRKTPSVTISEPTLEPILIDRPLDEKPSNLSASTSSSTAGGGGGTTRLAGHRPRTSVNAGDSSVVSDGDGGEHVADQSIAALLCSTSGGRCLKGVVAFVDVRTSEGTDSGKVFTDILKGLGAKVLTRPTESCTHIVYKSGKQATLNWFRRQDDPKPFIVGIKWVMESKKAGKRMEEGRFAVDVGEEDVFQKRRKSMEPKSLAASQGASGNTALRQAFLDVAQARRKSMMYAPKISSPLKKGYMTQRSDSERDF